MRYTGVTSRHQRHRIRIWKQVCYIGNRVYSIRTERIRVSLYLSLSPFYYLSLSPLSISTVSIRRTIDKLGGQNHQVRTILCPFCVREANYAKPNVPLTRFDLPTLHGICNEARKGSAIYNTRIYNLIPYSAGPFSEQE